MKTNSSVEKEEIAADYTTQLWITFYSYNNINTEYSTKHIYNVWGGW